MSALVIEKGEKYDPMEIDNETSKNMGLHFKFKNKQGENIAFVTMRIGGEWISDGKVKNEISSDYPLPMIQIYDGFKGKGWCKPLIIYSLKRSIQELS